MFLKRGLAIQAAHFTTSAWNCISSAVSRSFMMSEDPRVALAVIEDIYRVERLWLGA
jgi:hypothetical protein